jgi:hypothetical protein
MTPSYNCSRHTQALWSKKEVAVVVLPTIRRERDLANSTLMAIGAERRWNVKVRLVRK